MLPTLISFYSFSLSTLSVFVLLAIFFAGFVFWRKVREEHYDLVEIWDGFTLSVLVGIAAARLGFVLTHLYEFGFNIWLWFNIVARPGMVPLIGAMAASGYLFYYAKKRKWDPYEVLDFAVLSMSLGLALIWLGLFFDGTAFGYPTSMPWGVTFPQVVERHHPTQLYATVGYLLLFVYLSKLEYVYRTFEWYKAKRKSAQTGFLLSVFLVGYGVLQLLLTAVTPAQYLFYGIRVDRFLHVLIILFGIGLLYIRSGRKLPGMLSGTKKVGL